MQRSIVDLRSDGDVSTIWLIGDMHLGNVACDENGLRAMVEYIREFGHQWIGMGDHIDAISAIDFRFAHSSMAKWIDDIDDAIAAQIDMAGKMLAPIADQCLGMLSGNHESKIANRDKVNVHKILCDRLGVTNLGYTHWLTLRRGRKTYDAYLTHGHGGGRTHGAKVNRVQSLLADNYVDVAAMGHVHTASISTRGVRYATRGKVAIRPQWGVVTGTFLSDPAYGVNAGYGPVTGKQIKVMVDDSGLSVGFGG